MPGANGGAEIAVGRKDAPGGIEFDDGERMAHGAEDIGGVAAKQFHAEELPWLERTSEGAAAANAAPVTSAR
jgi:hypothetical protein